MQEVGLLNELTSLVAEKQFRQHVRILNKINEEKLEKKRLREVGFISEE